VIEEERVKGKKDAYLYATLCIDGYKFIMSQSESGKTMTQFFEERDGKSLPAKC